jgi:hypothetical protein
MKISQVYERFDVPPNLQEHMFRVAKMCLFISDHWKGINLDKKLIVKGALLHDLGNIVKFNFGKYLKLLDKELPRIDHWKNIQKKTIEKYGSDDHEVTIKMLEEINTSQKLKDIVSTKSFSSSLETEESDNWELKILYYADLRSGTFGVLPLKERLDEALPRLKKYKDLGNLDDLITACEDIEKQIQANLDTEVLKIKEENIVKFDRNFLDVEV